MTVGSGLYINRCVCSDEEEGDDYFGGPGIASGEDTKFYRELADELFELERLDLVPPTSKLEQDGNRDPDESVNTVVLCEALTVPLSAVTTCWTRSWTW